MSIVALLNGHVGKSPDEIVAELADPIRHPTSFHTLGLDGIRRIEGRRVHFLQRQSDGHAQNDSGSEGEVFLRENAYDNWCDRNSAAGRGWFLVSHEVFPTLDLETLELPDE